MKRRSIEPIETIEPTAYKGAHLYTITHNAPAHPGQVPVPQTPLSLAISDPAYATVLEAITALHESTKEKYKLKIKKIRQEATAQIQSLCHQLLQAQQALKEQQETAAVQETIHKNHRLELASLQEQLNEDSQRFQDKIERLKQENDALSQQLAMLQQQQHLWQLSTAPLEAEIQQLSRHNKEKTAQLIQAEQALEQAQQSSHQQQIYIESLENKSKKIQNELFEHWMQNKDHL